MAESVVSLTYGTALYEAAKDLGKEEQILIVNNAQVYAPYA